jgi:hypothetical protein
MARAILRTISSDTARCWVKSIMPAMPHINTLYFERRPLATVFSLGEIYFVISLAQPRSACSQLMA